MQKLFSLKNIDLTLAQNNILKQITWQVHKGEHWAILGANGSGKSTLLKVIMGELWPSDDPVPDNVLCPSWDIDPSIMPDSFDAPLPQGNSERVWYVNGKEETSPLAIKKHTSLVSPELQNWYFEHGWDLLGEELILSGLHGTPLVYNQAVPGEMAEVEALANELELEHLLSTPVASMSQGQLRSMLIARALAAKPSLLALDEVFEGLDELSRHNLSELLLYLAQNQTTLLITAHRQEDLPPCVTHALLLKEGRIVSQGPFDLLSTPLGQAQHSAAPAGFCPQSFGLAQNTEPGLGHASSQDTSASAPRPQVSSDESTAPPWPGQAQPHILLELNEVDIFIQRKQILHDINWTVERGQNWAILGPNGAGKSTLLRCLWGELHPAVGGKIAWFGQSELVNLPSLRQNLGLVSDRLQASIPGDLLAEHIVLSGFFASIDLYKTPNPAMLESTFEQMDYMRLLHLKGRAAYSLSYGELRRLLLCRALVHEPEILLLDEPCSGLDTAARTAFLQNLAQAVQHNQVQIIHVTHHPSDFAGITTHALQLDKGRVTRCGKIRATERI